MGSKFSLFVFSLLPTSSGEMNGEIGSATGGKTVTAGCTSISGETVVVTGSCGNFLNWKAFVNGLMKFGTGDII